MQLVESHLVKETNNSFHEIDTLCFASKNLYNKTNYIVRQLFFEKNNIINYASLYHLAKTEDEYSFLPAKVSQQTIKLVCQNWSSWLGAIKEYKKSPDKFLGKPRIPNYLKEGGRQVVIYTKQAISFINSDFIKLSKTNIEIRTKVNYDDIQQVRLVPKGSCYKIEVVYNVLPKECDLDYSLVAGIDLGINNLATVTSNKAEYIPFFVNGKPLKSLNQLYNKRKSKLQSKLHSNQFTSRQITKITEKRNRRIDNYLHKASRMIINDLVYNNIGVLVIGKNDGWKQKVNIGKRNNQNFVQIPHSRLVQMLQYKAELVGIEVILTEESYTSKCSFLDNEEVCKHEKYLGGRVKRGLFKSASGTKINADVNGSYNIIKKVFPNAFANGIEDVVVHPVKVNLRT